jgi:hypothetical protein
MVAGREGIMTEDSPFQVLLYPNPAKDKLNVELIGDHSSNATINVYNILGNKVMSSQNKIDDGTNILEVNTSILVNGIYIVEIENNGEVIRQRFSVSR